VDDVEAKQYRNVQPTTVDRQSLQPIDLPHVPHEQQRADLTVRQGGLHHCRLTGHVALPGRHIIKTGEIEELSQLPGLLLQRHLRQQLLDLRLYRAVTG
jgi:hypothetical protein